MKLRVKYSSRLVRKGYTAWVLYPFVFFRASRTYVSDKLFRHELEHTYQVERDGWLVFYIKWLYYRIKHGYLANPYEVEARLASVQPLTKYERITKGD